MKTYLTLVTVIALCFATSVFYSQNVGLGKSAQEKNLPLPDEENNSSVFVKNSPQEHMEGVNWSANINAISFAENKGQFNTRCKEADASILFGLENGGCQVFFRPTGVSYYLIERVKNFDRKKGDITKPKRVTTDDYVSFIWEGANATAKLVGKDLTADYYTYCMPSLDGVTNPTINGVRGFKKLVYENLYPGIDVEYVIHPEGGIKYSLILQPGADASIIKMVYQDEGRHYVLDDKGNLYIQNRFGAIIEQAPVTFYAGNNGEMIASKFVINGNTISFDLGNYDKTKTIIIDPWVQTPTISNSNCVWECDKDGAGNVYVIGGDAPMKLLKYSPTGVLQWTHLTPWDANPPAGGSTSGGDWLGSMATDLAGNSYVTNGSTAALQKIGPAGGTTWSVNAGGLGGDEYWGISFNCDQTRLLIGGTRSSGIAFPTHGTIFDVNTTNGSVNNRVFVTDRRRNAIDVDEVRSISSSKNGKYYFLTLDTIGAINQTITSCNSQPVFKTPHNYRFGYKSEYYRPNNGNAGVCAIRANDKFVYTQNGIRIERRSLINGMVINSVAIPGGISTSSLGFNQAGNNGIDVDDCGNVYVGSGDRVIKYDENLNLLSSTNLPFSVYDVSVSTNGDVIVVGGTGTSASTTRTGYVRSINMGACAPFPLECCDATICNTGPYCTTDAAVTLQAVQPGGVWAGPGITNTATGVFSPVLAGAGTHAITYTLPCGTDTILIKVVCCEALINPVAPMCRETAPITLTAATPGGTWSGPGITNTTTGTFDPVVAGWGNHLVVYAVPGCGNDTTIITVRVCMTVCEEPNGQYTVSNGMDPYTWQNQGPVVICIFCNGLPFFTCPGNCPFQFSITGWVNYSNGATITPPGNFPIRVLDSQGNTITINSAADVPPCTTCPNITTTVTSQININCTTPTGTATVSATGGTAPYTYNWEPGNLNGATQTGLAAGTYTVIATDANNCRDTITVTITSSGAFPTVNVTTTPTTCGQNNGSATANVSGGTGPFTYAWSPGAGATQTISNLAAASYGVIVTGSDGCTATATGTVAATPNDLTLGVANSIDPTCAGNDGSIDVSVSGGAPPYTVTLTPSNPPIVLNWPAANSQTVGGLSGGTVTVTVVDALGCQMSIPLSLTAPTNCCSFTLSAVLTQPTCAQSNGEIALTLANGSGNYTYVWSPNVSGGATASNLGAGTYNVTVTDNGFANCFIDTLFSLNSNSSLALSLTNPVNPTCAGNDGSITVGLSGGTAPYTVTIDTGSAPFTIAVPFAISQTINNLPDGTVNVTVVDADGCQVINSATLTAPTNCCTFTLSAALTQPSCAQNNGEIALAPANGSGNYTYVWNPNVSGGATASNLGAGTYNVIITDNGFTNCFIDTSFSLNSNSSLALSLTNPVNPTCAGNDGSITVGLSGGTAPYTVTIDTGSAPFTITVPFAISQTINNLSDGTVNVTVVDADGCLVINSATLTAPTNCCTFTLSAALTQPSCAQSNGEIALTTANGSGNYTYVWSPNVSGGATANNLGAGTYNVTITDNGFANCFIDTSFALNSNSSLALSLTNPINPTCAGNDGSITVGLSGGTAPYTVTIDTGSAPFTITVPFAISQTINNLPDGTVNVTVVDADGCLVINTATLTAPTNCCTFTLSAALTQPSCAQSNGEIALTTANGSGNYTYVWSPNVSGGATANNLGAGTYNVTITDNGFANCFIDTSFALSNPNAPVITLTNQTNINCNGNSTGSLTIALTGGTPPVTPIWNTGEMTPSISNLAVGTYTVTATDANGCEEIVSYTITEPTATTLQLTATAIDCTDPNSGSAAVVASGGTPPYTYLWSNAATAATLSDVSVGNYTVTVTDAEGCIAIDSVTVTGDVVSAFNLGPNLRICFGDSVILGTGLAGTVWSTGDTADYLIVTEAGTYTGTITNGNCSNSDSVTIFVEQIPNTPELNVNDTIVCEDETLILRVGDQGYLYVWSTGDTARQIVVDTPGIYVITAINECGEATAEALVTDENCACRLYMPNAFSPNDDGANDVFKAYTVCTDVDEFSLSIYDRWGGLVYRSNDLNEFWDGTSKGQLCTPGVYVYSLSYLSRENGVRQIYRLKGSVTLLR